MLLAPLPAAPRAIAEKLGASLQRRSATASRRSRSRARASSTSSCRTPGTSGAVRGRARRGRPFGAGGPGGRVQVEFVSANPTGPLTAASGRHAAFGDALARILELAGDTVEREYYFNDGGGQVRRLGESLLARARGEAPPEDGYKGEYVAAVAAQIPGAAEKSPDELAAAGVEILMAKIRETLERYRVALRPLVPRAHPVRRRAERLGRGPREADRRGPRVRERGCTVAADHGARRRREGPPAREGRGEPTYLAADVAYHWDKLLRGFDNLVNVLGSDHHGYVMRLKAISPPRGPIPAAWSCRCSSSSTSSRAESAPRCPSAAATSSPSPS